MIPGTNHVHRTWGQPSHEGRAVTTAPIATTVRGIMVRNWPPRVRIRYGLLPSYEIVACSWDSYEATTLTRKTMSGAPTLLGMWTSDSIQPLPCTRKLARTVPSQDDEAERRGRVCGFELTGRLHC